MTNYIYSVRDRVAGIYGPPMFAISDAVVLRSISATLSGGQSVMRHASYDFDVYCIGEFDDQSGSIVGFVPRQVSSLSSLVGGDQDVSDAVHSQRYTSAPAD